MSEKTVLTPIDPSVKLDELKGRQIYHTTYKKGPILGNLHFEHSGSFIEAVNDVKTYLMNKSLKHVHTVPFLIDIKSPTANDEI